MHERPGEPRWAIADFLTDGSLVAAADELGRLAGCVIRVHNADGSRIDHRPDRAPPWTLTAADADGVSVSVLAAAAAAGGEPLRRDDGRSVAPIVVQRRPSGVLAAEFEEDTPEDRRVAVERMLVCLASTAAEFCDEAAENDQHNAELAALFEISSLLVKATDLDEVLRVALNAGIGLTRASAGTIHLVAPEAPELRLAAHEGLPGPLAGLLHSLPADRVADHAALRGEIVRIDALAAEPDVLHAGELHAAGFRASLTVGLRFRGETLGMMRLYAPGGAEHAPRDRVLLRAVAEQISAAVAGAQLAELQRRRARLHRAMRTAADVQRRMLPSTLPQLPPLELAAKYVPSLALSGDFYDAFELSGALALAIGDVVGKGIPAALLMSATRAALRAHADERYHIDEIITRVNRRLTADTLDNEFVTLFYGVVDPASLSLTYCNAGHEPPLLFRSGSDRPEMLRTGGALLGVDAAAEYERTSLTLAPGDALLLYTDGLTDAMSFDGEKFGRPRLAAAAAEFLREHPDASAAALLDHAVWSMRRFTGLRAEADDVTALVVRVAR